MVREPLQKNALFVLHLKGGQRMMLQWLVESGPFLTQVQTLIYELLVQWCSTAIKSGSTIRGLARSN